MSPKSLSFESSRLSPSLPPAPLRLAAAALLQSSARHLQRLAQRVAGPPAQQTAAALPRLEFHAEAGALEGALYVDGRLVGHLPGIRRL